MSQQCYRIIFGDVTDYVIEYGEPVTWERDIQFLVCSATPLSLRRPDPFTARFSPVHVYVIGQAIEGCNLDICDDQNPCDDNAPCLRHNNSGSETYFTCHPGYASAIMERLRIKSTENPTSLMLSKEAYDAQNDKRYSVLVSIRIYEVEVIDREVPSNLGEISKSTIFALDRDILPDEEKLHTEIQNTFTNAIPTMSFEAQITPVD